MLHTAAINRKQYKAIQTVQLYTQDTTLQINCKNIAHALWDYVISEPLKPQYIMYTNTK